MLEDHRVWSNALSQILFLLRDLLRCPTQVHHVTYGNHDMDAVRVGLIELILGNTGREQIKIQTRLSRCLENVAVWIALGVSIKTDRKNSFTIDLDRRSRRHAWRARRSSRLLRRC